MLMDIDDEEKRKRLERARAISSSMSSDTYSSNFKSISVDNYQGRNEQEKEYISRYNRAREISNSINPRQNVEIKQETPEEIEESNRVGQQLWNLMDKRNTNTNNITSTETDEERIRRKMDSVWVDNNSNSQNTANEEAQWFQFKEFEDGYQFGDISKTALGTATNVLQKFAKGLFSPIENVADIGTNIVATGQDILGFDEAAKKTREFANKDITENVTSSIINASPIGMLYNIVNGEPGKIFNPAEIEYDPNKDILENLGAGYSKLFLEESEQSYDYSSVSGQYPDQIAELVGYTLGLSQGGQSLTNSTGVKNIGNSKIGASLSGGNIGLTLGGRTINLPTLAIAGGASGGLQEANEKGDNVTEVERWSKAFSGGIVEGITEGIFGFLGVGGNELTDELGKKFASKFSSKIAKMMANLGFHATGEAVEEFLSYAGNFLVDNGIIDKLGDTDFSTTWNWADVGEQMMLAFLSTGLTGGSAMIIDTNAAVKSAEEQLGRELTQEEKQLVTKAVVDETLNEQIQEMYQNEDIPQTFYTSTFNQDGSLSNIEMTRGKAIDNPNSKVNVSPAIVRTGNNIYTVIDSKTGLRLDTTPYTSILAAEAGFNSRMINLKDSEIRAINNKVSMSNIAVNEMLANTLRSIQNDIITKGIPTRNVQNKDTGALSSNVINNTIDSEKSSNTQNSNFQTDTSISTEILDKNPTLKTNVQNMANNFLEDLSNSTTGQRYKVGDTWTGQKRSTTKELASIKDSTGASWSQINNALEEISKGNITSSLSKKIIKYIDDALTNGYTNVYGQNIQSNEEYINAKKDLGPYKESNQNKEYGIIDDKDARVFGEKYSKKKNIYNKEKFNEIISTAINNPKPKGSIVLAKVNKKTADIIEKLTGINTINRIERITASDIRHILNHHGDKKIEAEKGQLPITKTDIKKIPDVIENFDNIEKGNLNIDKNGKHQTVRFIKEYNNNALYVVEVVPSEGNALIIKTMWKKPIGLSHGSNTLRHTSETKTNHGSSTSNNNSISQKQNSVKENTIVNNKSTQKIQTIYRKFSKDFHEKGYIDLNGRKVNNIREAADIAQVFRNPNYETFRILYTKGNVIVGQEAVSSRIPGQSNIFKDNNRIKGFYNIKDRMKRLNADGYYMIHNHPSGNAVASQIDINTTQKFYNNVPGFKAHIIVNSGTYAVIEQERSALSRLVTKNEINIENYTPDEIDKMMTSTPWSDIKIKSNQDIAKLMHDVKNNPNYSTLILTDSKSYPRIILDIPNNFFNMRRSQIDGYIKNIAKQNGAIRAFIATTNSDVYNSTNKLITITDSILYSIKGNDILEENTLSRNDEDITKQKIFSNSDLRIKQVTTEALDDKTKWKKAINNKKEADVRAEKISTTNKYDNQGRTLTKQQQEYFKDSKVRDEKGNLLTLYHGSSNQFTIFDQNRAGKSTEDASIGFWFTETREGADKFNRGAWYGNGNSNVYEVYLNIKNPKIYRSIDNSTELEQVDNRLKENKQKQREIENNNFAIEVNSSDIRWASDERELQDIARNYGVPGSQINKFVTQSKEYQKLLKEQYNLEKEYENKRYNDAYEQFKNDIYAIAGKTPGDANIGGTGMYIENYSEVVKQYKQNLIDQGYDGIIIEGTRYDSEYFGRNNNQYVAFNSNQIKNVTNTNPTSNQDIRFERTKSTQTSRENIAYNEKAQSDDKNFIKNIQDNNYLQKLMSIDNNQGSTNAQSSERLIEQQIQYAESIGAFDDTIPVTKLSDIQKTIENYLGKGIYKGHFKERAYGIYKSKNDTIRVKEYKDIDNILHETGHALDLGKRLNIDKESIANELLEAVRRHGGYEDADRSVQLDEGFAEVIRTYVINPSQSKIDYPQTITILEGIRLQDKSFNDFIQKVQSQIYNYIHQNPRNRVLSNVSIGEQTDKTPINRKTIKENVMRLVYDKDYLLKSTVNEFAKLSGKKPSEIAPSRNAYILTRLASGVNNKAISMISDGYIDINGNKLMPGLNKLGEILSNDHQRFNDLRAYLVAKRDLEYKAKTLKTGIRTLDSKAVVEQFQNDVQINEAAQIVYDTLDGVLQYAVNNGLITQDTATALRESNAFYVPFQRVIGNNGNQVGRRGAVSDIIKGRTGSELDIKDVLENIVVNSANIIQQVENNNVLRALYDQGEELGMKNNIFDEIPTPVQKVGTATLSTWKNELRKQGIDVDNIDLERTIDIFAPNNKVDQKNLITSFIDTNGNRVYLQFAKGTDDIFNSIIGLDKNSNSLFLRLMRKLNMPLRYGATMANIGFAIPNMISDTVQASIYSEAGFIPVLDNFIGILDILSATNKTVKSFVDKISPEYSKRIEYLYSIYSQSGASSSTRLSQYRKSSQEIMKDIYGTKNSKTLGIKESFIPLKRLLDIMTYIPELSEQSTRFRVFERNYEAYKNKGGSETDARIKAAIESRDATQDFGRTGVAMREINQLIPFSAARVGSAYTFSEKITSNTKAVTTRIALLSIVALLIKFMGYDDKEIEELNQRKKNDNFVLKIGDTVITIKKPQGILRSIINLEEYISDLVTGHIEEGKEGEKLVEWFENALMDNLPADEAGGLVPNAIAPIIENSINKDFYYNTDIVKSYDLDLPESEQYYDYTSQVAIWLGKIFNYSPAKIDNLISGYLGGLGTQITNSIDWISGKLGLSAEEPEMGAEDNAVGKRFVVNVNENSASIDEVYTLKDELTKKKNGGTITQEESEQLERLEEATSNMANINKQIKAIKQDLSMSGTEKEELIRPLQEQKTDVARNALGKDLIYTQNISSLESLKFYPTRDTLSSNGYSLYLTEDMKKEYESLAYSQYQKYQKQGLYSEEYLEQLESKCKDYAKNYLMKKYKTKLTKSK